MLNSNLSDQELIQNYLKGDNASFETLIHRHKRKVYTSIVVMVKDNQLADDIFQDTFIKVIDKLHEKRYKEDGKFLGWVIRIAHNLVIDHFRKEKHFPMVRDTEEYNIFDRLDLLEESAQDAMEVKQSDKQLQELIDELPYEQKEVLILRHYCQMSFKDIAKSTNVSINTALGRMRYALIHLRKLIEERELNFFD
jgi:RNA polymerase sigma-70 factor (ECF subfamily)